MRFPLDAILVCIRWYVTYPLSCRHLEGIMAERGASVEHSSIKRWTIRFLPLIEKLSRKHKCPVGGSWRMDETYIKVKGAWKHLYRADGCRIDRSWSHRRHFCVLMRPSHQRKSCHGSSGAGRWKSLACWYRKEQATFSDTIAQVRRCLWGERGLSISGKAPDMVEIPRELFERLTDTLS